MNKGPGTLIFQGLRGFFRGIKMALQSAGSKAGKQPLVPISDYKRVKRAFGHQEVEQAVEAICRREQADKARKRPQRSIERGGRQKRQMYIRRWISLLNIGLTDL